MNKAIATGILVAGLAASAQADTGLEAGISQDTFFAGRLFSTKQAHVRATHDGFFIQGTYEAPRVQLKGQNLGRIKLLGVGGGYEFELTPRVNVTMGAMYYQPWVETDPVIRNEAVDTQLSFDHAVGLGQAPHWDHTVYDVDTGLGGFGEISYEIKPWASVFAGGKVLTLREKLDACTGEDPTCNFPVAPGERHWQNREALNMTSVYVGVKVVW